jgi:hypothetical protein
MLFATITLYYRFRKPTANIVCLYDIDAYEALR